MRDQDRQLLQEMFEAAVHAAEPGAAMRPFLPARPRGRVVVVGAGKGAAQMAAALEDLWDGPLEGGGGHPLRVRRADAGHPGRGGVAPGAGCGRACGDRCLVRGG